MGNMNGDIEYDDDTHIQKLLDIIKERGAYIVNREFPRSRVNVTRDGDTCVVFLAVNRHGTMYCISETFRLDTIELIKNPASIADFTFMVWKDLYFPERNDE